MVEDIRFFLTLFGPFWVRGPCKKGPQPVIYNKARTGRTLANMGYPPVISPEELFEEALINVTQRQNVHDLK